MAHASPRVWTFDRFKLDLARHSLTSGGEDIELRPKTFDVLCYLVQNAGRVISKQELHDAVWVNVSVSDDSFVQCVRELRQKLGDDAHQLIKTVSRRGYLFDAVVTPATSIAPSDSIGVITPPATAPPARSARSGRVGAWWTGGALLCGAAVLLGAYLQRLPSRIDRFFSTPIQLSAPVTQHIAALAAEKGLPVPEFHILAPHADVPEYARRFIGVWVSDQGWDISGRQLMLIVTDVNPNAMARGYLVNGPGQARSRVPGPAFAVAFSGQITDRTLRYDGRIGMAHATVLADGRMQYRMAFESGGAAAVMLDPVWTLSAVSARARADRER